jgi:hypothetical protein
MGLHGHVYYVQNKVAQQHKLTERERVEISLAQSMQQLQGPSTDGDWYSFCFA